MYIEWGISYSSSDCFLINIWEVPNFQQPTSEYECVSKPSGTTPPNLPKSVLLKIKRFLIEAKYQQQAAFNVLLPPKKNTPKTTVWGRFQFPQRISVFSKPPVWGDESPVSFTAAFWLERKPSSSARPFRGFSTRKKGRPTRWRCYRREEFVGEMELPHSLIVFLCISILNMNRFTVYIYIHI